MEASPRYVRHRSGSNFHVNLDSVSIGGLNACQTIHHSRGCSYSNNVIMRRALRVYHKHLQAIRTESAFTQELVEIERAAKGIH